jgi:23S rRNA (guanosine2251-2'-O)-methyltransferase
VAIEILYGRHAVHEALRAGRRRFYTLNLATGVQEGGLIAQLQQLAAQAGCPVQRVDKTQFNRMLPDVNHQGVALEASTYPYGTVEQCLQQAAAQGEPPLLLMLDHLEDPQNLGTLLRTAEAMGLHGVIIPERRAAGILPSVSNASSGAVEHLHVARVVNLAQTQQQLKRQKLWIAGLEDRPEAQDLARSDLSGPLVIVVGNEHKGLSQLVRAHCDWLVRIPMTGQVASLNAAVAGSVVLVAARQSRSGGTRE